MSVSILAIGQRTTRLLSCRIAPSFGSGSLDLRRED
jgi:hypothetical protein